MASAFSHIAIPAVLYASFKSKSVNFKLFLLAAFCSVLPDADVITFKFGIAYESQWGHRGFTHSLLFAFALASICSLFCRKIGAKPLSTFALCFIACASHPLLDAMTNGGLGVALYWPFSTERLFFPFRPIQVSPIGVGSFFSEKGFRVIISELIWVLLPSLLLGIMGFVWRRRHEKQRR